MTSTRPECAASDSVASTSSFAARPSDAETGCPNPSARFAVLCEIAGVAIACGGVVLFGFGVFPLVNPIQWRLNVGDAYLTASRGSLAASLIAMSIGWRLSCLVQRAKKCPVAKV